MLDPAVCLLQFSSQQTAVRDARVERSVAHALALLVR
jgi:hypothetical protein